MPPGKKILAYLVFGTRPEYEFELIFSALSALQRASTDPGFTVCVITDRPSLASRLEVDTLPLSSEDLILWTQNGRCIFRAKPLALLKVLENYAAPVALVDTDTCFRNDPLELFRRISGDESLLHSSDGYLIGESPMWAPILPFIDELKESEIPVSRKTEMLNSGVIGVHPDNGVLIEKGVALLDRLHAHTPIFNIEQLAVGAALQSKTRIRTCEDIVDHYWGYRRRFVHLRIQRYLAASRLWRRQDWIERSATIDTAFPAQPAVDRIITKLRAIGSRWDGDYRFAYLTYRLAHSYAEKDAGIASIWAASSLDALRRSLQADAGNPGMLAAKRNRSRSDFHRFAEPALQGLSWLEKDVSAAWSTHWKTEENLRAG